MTNKQNKSLNTYFFIYFGAFNLCNCPGLTVTPVGVELMLEPIIV